MIEIEEINSLDGLRAVQSEWDSFLSQVKARSIFLTHAWIRLWWKYFGADKRLFILILREEGQIVGIAPLMIVKSRWPPVRVVKFISTEPYITSGLSPFARFLGFGSRYGQVDLMDIILKDRPTYVLDQILKYLLQKMDLWDVIDFQALNPFSSTHTVLQELLQSTDLICEKRLPTSSYYLPIVENENIETYKKSLGKNVKKNLSRTMKRIAEKGKLELRRYRDLESIQKVLPVVIELEAKGWKGRRQAGFFANQSWIRDFHLEIVEAFARYGWLDLSLLYFEEKIVAYLCSFVYDEKYYEYGCAYDPDFSYYSPGLVLQWMVIEEAFVSGIKEIDLMMVLTPMKAQLRLCSRDYVQLMAFKPGPYTKALHGIEFKLVPALKRAKEKYQGTTQKEKVIKVKDM